MTKKCPLQSRINAGLSTDQPNITSLIPLYHYQLTNHHQISPICWSPAKDHHHCRIVQLVDPLIIVTTRSSTTAQRELVKPSHRHPCQNGAWYCFSAGAPGGPQKATGRWLEGYPGAVPGCPGCAKLITSFNRWTSYFYGQFFSLPECRYRLPGKLTSDPPR